MKQIKKVKVWAWFSCRDYKPFVKDFGVIFATEKEAKRGSCPDDIIIPCEIHYKLPKKK